MRKVWFAVALAMAGSAALAASTNWFPKTHEALYTGFIAGLPPAARHESWLVADDEMGSGEKSLSVHGTPVTYVFVCKDHACDTDYGHFFFYPGGTRFTAVIALAGKRSMIGGAGAAELACVAKLDATGGLAKSC
jgi:hypothetical protein